MANTATIGWINESSLWIGLVSYYKLDETSGNAIDAADGNNGTLHGGVTQGVTGKINTGYRFDGTGYVDCGNPSNLSLTNSGTLAAWIFQTNNATDQAIISKGNPGSDINGFTLASLSGGYSWWELANGTSHQSGESSIISPSTWTHFALTWDGSNIISYFNGVGDSPVTQTIIPVSNVHNFRIGVRGDLTGDFLFIGTLDEIPIWNRALTSSEISLLYNSGNARQYPN